MILNLDYETLSGWLQNLTLIRDQLIMEEWSYDYQFNLPPVINNVPSEQNIIILPKLPWNYLSWLILPADQAASTIGINFNGEQGPQGPNMYTNPPYDYTLRGTSGNTGVEMFPDNWSAIISIINPGDKDSHTSNSNLTGILRFGYRVNIDVNHIIPDTDS